MEGGPPPAQPTLRKPPFLYARFKAFSAPPEPEPTVSSICSRSSFMSRGPVVPADALLKTYRVEYVFATTAMRTRSLSATSNSRQ